jgi:hypothetical protein
MSNEVATILSARKFNSNGNSTYKGQKVRITKKLIKALT